MIQFPSEHSPHQNRRLDDCDCIENEGCRNETFYFRELIRD